VRVEQPGQVYFEGSKLQTEQREGCAVGNFLKIGGVDVVALSCLFEGSPLGGKVEGFCGRDGCKGSGAAIWDVSIAKERDLQTNLVTKYGYAPIAPREIGKQLEADNYNYTTWHQ